VCFVSAAAKQEQQRDGRADDTPARKTTTKTTAKNPFHNGSVSVKKWLRRKIIWLRREKNWLRRELPTAAQENRDDGPLILKRFALNFFFVA